MATMSRICKVCKRRFSIPARTRPRNTCGNECLNELLALNVNIARNKSGQFVCEDESGRQPHDPTPADIAEFMRQQGDARWAQANLRRMKTID